MNIRSAIGAVALLIAAAALIFVQIPLGSTTNDPASTKVQFELWAVLLLGGAIFLAGLRLVSRTRLLQLTPSALLWVAVASAPLLKLYISNHAIQYAIIFLLVGAAATYRWKARRDAPTSQPVSGVGES